MPVLAAYLCIILIWSTTPLAIKWSADGPGFLFGVSSRMVLGAVFCLLVIRVLRQPLPWHRQARYIYLLAGLAFYGAMMAVYWGAQFIPSGLISVIFGLTPLVTGLLAAFFLRQERFGFSQLTGVAFGLCGLAVIFSSQLTFGGQARLGILAVLLSVVLHSLSTVSIKSMARDLSPLMITTGGLLVAAPLYLLTLGMSGSPLPLSIPARAGMAIVYLALFGSVIGFILYYYTLKNLDAGQVALITLITPVLALFIGHVFNHEAINFNIIGGAALVLAGLVSYQWPLIMKSYQRRHLC